MAEAVATEKDTTVERVAMGTTGDVAKLLGCSTKTVTRLPVPGRTKIGRLTRYNLSAVRAWLDAGCPTTKS